MGRSVPFSDPTRPPVGGVGRPPPKKNPPPPPNKIVHAFQNHRNIFKKKKFSREKNLEMFRLPPPPPPNKVLQPSPVQQQMIKVIIRLVTQLTCGRSSRLFGYINLESILSCEQTDLRICSNNVLWGFTQCSRLGVMCLGAHMSLLRYNVTFL